jgi:hypothetical protein
LPEAVSYPAIFANLWISPKIGKGSPGFIFTQARQWKIVGMDFHKIETAYQGNRPISQSPATLKKLRIVKVAP